MKVVLWWVLWVFTWYSGMALAQGPTVWMALDGFAYAEPMPLQSFADKWTGHYSGGDVASLQTGATLGAQWHGWGVGLVSRQQLAANFTEDTARFYYQIENKLPLEAGHDYQIDLSVNYVTMQGVKLQRRFEVTPQFRTTLGVNLLEGLALLHGRLNGVITPISSKDYDYANLKLDYHYAEDKLFDREVVAPHGSGYSLDVDVELDIARRWKSRMHGRNLFGYIDWRNAPTTVAQVNSDNKDYDDNGYVIVHPTLSGQHSYQDFRQRLRPVWQSENDFVLTGKSSAVLDLHYVNARVYSAVGGSYALGAGSVRLTYMPVVDAVGIGYDNPYIKLFIASDALNLNKSRLLVMRASVLYSF